jgi:hypothetical protein
MGCLACGQGGRGSGFSHPGSIGLWHRRACQLLAFDRFLSDHDGCRSLTFRDLIYCVLVYIGLVNSKTLVVCRTVICAYIEEDEMKKGQEENSLWLFRRQRYI